MTDNQITRVGADTPAWLAEAAAEDRSLDNLKQFKLVPRISIVQGMSDRELKSTIGEGSLFLSSGPTKLAELDEAVKLVPLFSFEEFLKWKDRKDQSAGPALVDRTTDPKSELAKKCLDRDTWDEPYDVGGTKFNYRNVHQITIICFILEGQAAGEIVSLGFAKGSHKFGRQFANAALMTRAPLWAQCWTVTSEVKTSGDGQNEFYAPILKRHAEAPFLEEEQALKMREAYREFEKLHADGLLGSAEDAAEARSEGDGETEGGVEEY